MEGTGNLSTEVVATNPFTEGSFKPVSEIAVVAPVVEEKVVEVVDEKKVEEKKEEVAAPVIEEKKAEEVKIIEEQKPTFANEESEKVYNLLLDGKIDDVVSIITEQKKLSGADKLPPADIIKLNLQYQNKDFSPEEVNDLFEETYNLPERPVQSITENDDDFKVREQKYKDQVDKIEKRIARDSKPAAAELLKLSKEIVLPNIKKEEVITQEPTQEELEAGKVKKETFLKSVNEGVELFNGYKTTFKDEEVELNISYPTTKEEKEQSKRLIELSESNGVEFLKEIGWLNDKGELNTKKMAEDLPLITNKEAVFSKLITETGNQRYAAAKKSIRNIDYSGKPAGSGEMGATPEQLQGQMVNHFFSS